MQGINLTLRAVMEGGIILGAAYWGFKTGPTTTLKIVLAVGSPLLVFGFWGLVDFHQAGSLAEPLRLVQELLLTGLVAYALYSVGQPIPGVVFGVLSIVYHGLVYLSGRKLLKPSLLNEEKR